MFSLKSFLPIKPLSSLNFIINYKEKVLFLSLLAFKVVVVDVVVVVVVVVVFAAAAVVPLFADDASNSRRKEEFSQVVS